MKHAGEDVLGFFIFSIGKRTTNCLSFSDENDVRGKINYEQKIPLYYPVRVIDVVEDLIYINVCYRVLC